MTEMTADRKFLEQLMVFLDQIDDEWRCGGYASGYSNKAFIANRLASAFEPVIVGPRTFPPREDVIVYRFVGDRSEATQ